MSTKITYKDVLEFFNEADTDLAELTLAVVQANLADAQARAQAQRDKMAKARAGRGKAKVKPEIVPSAGGATEVEEASQPRLQTGSGPLAQARARRVMANAAGATDSSGVPTQTAERAAATAEVND